MRTRSAAAQLAETFATAVIRRWGVAREGDADERSFGRSSGRHGEFAHSTFSREPQSWVRWPSAAASRARCALSRSAASASDAVTERQASPAQAQAASVAEMERACRLCEKRIKWMRIAELSSTHRFRSFLSRSTSPHDVVPHANGGDSDVVPQGVQNGEVQPDDRVQRFHS